MSIPRHILSPDEKELFFSFKLNNSKLKNVPFVSDESFHLETLSISKYFREIDKVSQGNFFLNF